MARWPGGWQGGWQKDWQGPDAAAIPIEFLIINNLALTLAAIQDNASPTNTEWNIINNLSTTLAAVTA
jgi:hypothetical protein